MALYDKRVITDLIKLEIERRGRGSQSRLAEALGIPVQTVNKWVHHQTTPEPDKWPSIEAHFDWPRGHIAGVAQHRALDGMSEMERARWWLMVTERELEQFLAAYDGEIEDDLPTDFVILRDHYQGAAEAARSRVDRFANPPDPAGPFGPEALNDHMAIVSLSSLLSRVPREVRQPIIERFRSEVEALVGPDPNADLFRDRHADYALAAEQGTGSEAKGAKRSSRAAPPDESQR